MSARSKNRGAAGRWLRYAATMLASASFLSAPVAVWADTDTHHPMRFDRISLDDGLSQSNVFSILQDSRGVMWFGTENGLNSYNGYEFEVFKRKRGNPAALGSDYIYDIAEDASGTLWIASNGGGLARMDRESKTFASYRHSDSDATSIGSNVIRRLLVDADGTIWVGTLGAGVDHFDPRSGVAKHYRFEESGDIAVNTNEIFALYRDASGTLWIGTNNGLLSLDTESGESTHYTHTETDPSSIAGHRVRAVFEDSQGQLWVGTYSGGLSRLDRESGSFLRFRHDADDATSLSGDRVTSIFEDADARLWVGTFAGLNLLNRDTGGFVRFAHESQDASSLGDNAVTSIFQDRTGMLWVGTKNRGLNKWNPLSWSYGYEDARKLAGVANSQPNVSSFVEDLSGTLWIGTFGDGLHAVDRVNDVSTAYRHDAADPNSISDDRIMSLALDSAGNVWVGTMTGGLNRLNPETGENTVFRHDVANPSSLSADGIMAIFEDSTGLIWVGTYGGGASRFDPASETFARFLPSAEEEGAISSNRVRSFAEDAAGNIWVGTDAGGLNLFNPATQTFQHFRHDPFDPTTLADDTVYAVNVDQKGTVWVGTQGGGLDRVVGNAADPQGIEFSNVSQTEGLTNDVIYGVQFDNSGTLWLSTNYGISRFNPETGRVRNMHRKDGLQSEEFNSGAHYRSKSGELFFGGPNGYNAFDPDAVSTSSVAPQIVVTNIFSGNEPIKSGLPLEDGIDFSYKDDVISFEVAALDYTTSALIQYRYKLEGFDKEWIDLGGGRKITYTDLNDGNYLLRVQASNSEGVWNEIGLAIPVRVLPAPWDTWWAYLGYFAMVAQLAAFLWFGHKRKVRREEEYSGRLEEEVRERTEKLLESNQKLKELNHALQETSLSDPLTGLRNRRFVFEEVSRDLDVIRRKLADEDQGLNPKNANDLVFMMIDLDNFKPINDTYGHAAGDQMLLEVRDVLLGTSRKSDFVVRWGGDEFVVIAKQAKAGESEALAERIRSKIANHSFMLADGQVIRTTCSIGFAAFPLFRGQAEDADLDQILTLADTLMYEAKRQKNAWAGILSPTLAVTSGDFDHSGIEPSSMLFRSMRAGQLIVHGEDADRLDENSHISAAG